MRFMIRKELAGAVRYIVVGRMLEHTFDPNVVSYDPEIRQATIFHARGDAERWVSALSSESTGSFTIIPC
jgi:hypothetical protein